MKLKRLLTQFVPKSPYRKGEIDISDIPLEKLKEIFHPPADDPLMYNCYRVTVTSAQSLQPLLQHKLDLQRYEYYAEVESDN
jgi:hypothetical protein